VGGYGGGISNVAHMILNNCLIANNSCDADGAGIYNQGTLTLTDSTVTNNLAHHNGGGIINGDGGNLTIVRSTIDDNTADIGGGGIYNTSSTLNVSDSTIANNAATSTAAPTASNVTGGGGLDATAFAHVTITNTTIAGNVTGWAGGGVALTRPAFGSFINLVNTLVATNSAGDHGPDAAGAMISQGSSLIGQTDGSTGWNDSDLTGTSASPLDPLLGPLQDNGGPTQTMALLAGSPALNAGDPDQLGSPDQRGVIRTGSVNIGAYQASASTFLLIAPDAIQAGVPFNLSVTALDPFGQVAYGYTGTVTFASDNNAAVLPAAYQFQTTDQGSAVFTVTLNTPGPVHLTVTDTADNTVFAALDLIVL
jgi:hypothetical protein